MRQTVSTFLRTPGNNYNKYKSWYHRHAGWFPLTVFEERLVSTGKTQFWLFASFPIRKVLHHLRYRNKNPGRRPTTQIVNPVHVLSLLRGQFFERQGLLSAHTVWDWHNDCNFETFWAGRWLSILTRKLHTVTFSSKSPKIPFWRDLFRERIIYRFPYQEKSKIGFRGFSTFL